MTTVNASFILTLYVVSLRSRERAILLLKDVTEQTTIIDLARYISDLTSLIEAIDDTNENMKSAEDGKIDLSFTIKNLVELCAESEGKLNNISTISLDLH
tara:strand:- start:14749 stop:15048 length:300 start_codon:yes stop_codon:yes gene_type:complete